MLKREGYKYLSLAEKYSWIDQLFAWLILFGPTDFVFETELGPLPLKWEPYLAKMHQFPVSTTEITYKQHGQLQMQGNMCSQLSPCMEMQGCFCHTMLRGGLVGKRQEVEDSLHESHHDDPKWDFIHPSTGCFYVSHKQPELALISFWTLRLFLMPLWTLRSLTHAKMLWKKIKKPSSWND